jgi:hypothetical protein
VICLYPSDLKLPPRAKGSVRGMVEEPLRNSGIEPETSGL